MKISFQWLTGNDNQSKGLWPIEWLAITYSILTTLTMFVLWPDMNHPWDMFADRLYIFLGTILLWRIYLLWPRRLMTFYPYHGTDGFAQLLVSGHLRVQPDVPQFGPHIRPMGCRAVRLPALIGIQPPLPMALVFQKP